MSSMRWLAISVVDVLGVFGPGLLFIVGLGLCPALYPLYHYYELTPEDVVQLLDHWPLLGCLVALSYIAGLSLRFISIALLERVTAKWWQPLVGNLTVRLLPELRASLQSDRLLVALLGNRAIKLCEEVMENRGKCEEWNVPARQGGTVHWVNPAPLSMDTTPTTYADRPELSASAPLFAYLKRQIFCRNPDVWPNVLRLEAELRFLAGLLMPFALLILDGVVVFLTALCGWSHALPPDIVVLPSTLLMVLAGLATVAVVRTFPRRRAREVKYLYFWSFIVFSERNVKQTGTDGDV